MLRALILALALALVPFASAKSAPTIRERDGDFVLSNDVLKVVFNGKRPDLAIAPAIGGDAYRFAFARLVEFHDSNMNGELDADEVRIFVDLSKASWVATNAATGEFATLNLSTTAPVAIAAPVGEALDVPVQAERTAVNVTLSFTAWNAPATVEASGIDLPIASESFHWGMTVHAWPWLDAENDRLALEIDVEGAATRASQTGIESIAVSQGTAMVGAVTWTSNATGTKTEKDRKVPVLSTVEGNATATRVAFVYDAASLARLRHDGTAGLAALALGEAAGETEIPSVNLTVPAPGFALVAFALVGAVVAGGQWNRRKR